MSEPRGLDLLVMAGGESRRMGRDKTRLHFPGPEDPTLLEGVVQALRPLADRVLVAGPARPGLEAQFVADDPAARGPLGGLLAGLESASAELVLVSAADLPGPSRELAQGLLGLALKEPGWEAVVPSRGGRLEPLFAVYRRRARAGLRAAAAAAPAGPAGPSLQRSLGRLALRVVEEPEWRVWDPEGRGLTNCNTPEELDRAAARRGSTRRRCA